MSAAEDEFAIHLKAHKIPFEREYLFAKSIGRKWRSDFFIEPDILIEIDGGAWVNGRHNRGKGFIADMEKRNCAVLLGYRPFTFEPGAHVRSGLAIEMITRALAEPDEVRVK